MPHLNKNIPWRCNHMTSTGLHAWCALFHLNPAAATGATTSSRTEWYAYEGKIAFNSIRQVSTQTCPCRCWRLVTRGGLSRTRAWQGAIDSNWKAFFHVGTLQTLLGLFWALGPPLSLCRCFRKPCGLSGCAWVTAGPRTTMPRLPWSLGRSLFLHNLSTTWFSRLSSVKLVCFHPWNYIHLGNTSSY